MKKYGKYICGVLTAAMLVSACAYWPVPMALAAEEGGQKGQEGTAGEIGTEEVPVQDGLQPEDSAEPSEESGQAENPQEEGDSRTGASLDQETAEWVDMAGEALAEVAADRDIMALVYLSEEYPVRTRPSYESDTEVTVLSGQMVNILDVYVDDEMEIWHYVRLDYKGSELYGYVPRTNLACSDERFLVWEEMYGMNFATYTVEGERAAYADVEQFPESYRAALTALKDKHPNWIFVMMNTTLDWGTSIQQELKGGKSLVYKTFPEWAIDRSQGQNGHYGGNWYYASQEALELYMDPRNSLTESAIFQFEQLTYNPNYHTLEAMTSFLNQTNSFMKEGVGPGTNRTYADLFYSVGVEVGVSPFHLAARVIQEQGAGTSPLISGTYPGYEGYYNYFNIKASGTSDKEVIENGLQYAMEQGWTDAEKSIRGGANVISANYIKKGQDTLYLQKFNVNPNGGYAVYTHQYMQNISAPTTEAPNIRKQYEQTNSLESAFVFKIPVYYNMPGEPAGMPSISTDVILALPEGYADTTVWLDGVAYPAALVNGQLVVTAPDGNAKTAVVYRYDEAGVPVGMYVWSLSFTGTAYIATAEPGLQDLLTYHGFSIRITGKSGIRYKTGISTSLRSQLTSGGVNGYMLKEYGTLVMNQANMGQYPMVKDGAKVKAGISYGRDSSGNMQDVVFETVDGRYRFTSVFVGLPVEQYKTQFAFRGYAVLEKNGIQTVVYGPVKASSIYDLAKILLEKGSYAPGTEPHAFLQKLVGDADALNQ